MVGRDWLVMRGFSGFVTIEELRASRLADVPRVAGVYAVLREAEQPPIFLSHTTARRFEDRDPNIARALLDAAWVPGSQVVYLGKAGETGRKSTVRTRLRQYFDFGAGKADNHWGGRYLWHLADSAQLLVAWRETADLDPRSVESELLDEFEAATGTLPFANLQR